MLRIHNKILTVLASTLLLLISFSISADNTWIKLASADDGSKWEALVGSFEFAKTKNNVPIALLAGRVTSAKRKQIDLNKWYVTGADCKSEMGKLVTLSVSGEYQFENDFIFDSGNAASLIAKFICEVAELSIKKSDSKSLK